MVNLQISGTLTEQYTSNAPMEALLRNDNFFVDAAQKALHLSNQDQNAELTLVLTDDAQIHELNRQYRQVDAPTDVLSFPVGETDPDTGNLYLGDILISIPRALAQSQAEDRPIEAELRLLVVHGVLHLLGYDHANEQEKAAMWAVQTEILAHL
jgi:probable rRNA maturation factor